MTQQDEDLLDAAHDRFVAADRAYRVAPSIEAQVAAEEAYRDFYTRFNRGSVGLDDAMAELRVRLRAAVTRAAA